MYHLGITIASFKVVTHKTSVLHLGVCCTWPHSFWPLNRRPATAFLIAFFTTNEHWKWRRSESYQSQHTADCSSDNREPKYIDTSTIEQLPRSSPNISHATKYINNEVHNSSGHPSRIRRLHLRLPLSPIPTLHRHTTKPCCLLLLPTPHVHRLRPPNHR
jgi:hypothetical protein